MSVKVSLGGQLLINENQLEEAKSKISLLSISLKDKDETIKNLQYIISTLQTENTALKSENGVLSSKNLEFLTELEISNKQIKNLQNEISGIEKVKNEFMAANRILRVELENLNLRNDENILKNKKFIHEYEETEKVKNKFEDNFIYASEVNENLIEKIKVYEQVLKQKEKYINILIKKKDVSLNSNDKGSKELNTINSNFETLNEEIKMKNSKFNQTKINTKCQQKKISDLEDIIKQKDNDIKKLENEKINLVTRLRNSINNKNCEIKNKP
jgi:chromosome segregation ATPase